MLYNEMIPVDTHDSTGTETNFCGPFGKNSGLYSMESPYDTPALPGGGGSTPPSYGPMLPTGGSSSGGSSGPLPGLGGGGWSGGQKSGGSGGSSGGGAGQYVNADTIAAGTNLLGGLFGMIGASKAAKGPIAGNVKAVCGRKPLFNIGGKKDAYFACAERVANPQPVYTPPPAKSNVGLIVGIVLGVVILGIIITVVIVKSKQKQVVA